MSPGDWLLFFRAIPLLVTGSFLQRAIPMTTWGHLLGTPGPVPESLRKAPRETELSGEPHRIYKAIARGSTVLPWTPSCLAQAFAAQRILHSRGDSGDVLIGLQLSGDARWPAHAWLVWQGQTVTGGQAPGQFTPATLYRFDSPSMR